jgi:hypothetical protein
MRTNLIKSHAYPFLACHSVNFDPSLSHPSTPLVRRACTCFSTALSTAKLGIIGASTDRLARHIAQEGASLCHVLIRSNETFQGTHVFPDPSPPTLSAKSMTAWITQVGKCAVKRFISPESWIRACFPLQDVTASRTVNVRMCLSSKWCSDPDMGQFISSSKLFKYSFNIFLEDSFCFSLCRLQLGSSVGGEDNSCTTLVDLTSGCGIGDERSPLLPSALEFVSFTSSSGSPADGQQ